MHRPGKAREFASPDALRDMPLPAVGVRPGQRFLYELADEQESLGAESAWWAWLLIALFAPLIIVLLVVVAAIKLVGFLFYPVVLLVPAGRRWLRARRYQRKHKVSVELDRNPVAPGEQVAGAVRLKNPGPATRITVALACEEHITYRRGTDTYHDDHRTTEHTLATFEGPGDLGRYDEAAPPRDLDFTFTLPPDAMHSFHSANNELRWLIEVRREFADALPVQEQFYFQVLPIALLDRVVTELLSEAEAADRTAFAEAAR